MAYFRPIYVVFNQCECLFWWAFGACFVYLLVARRPRNALLVPEVALVACFAVFGLSDYVESTDTGGLPAYLWLWKIINGIVLFALLIGRDYLLRGRGALAPGRFVAAGSILSLALYQAIFHAG